MRTYLISYDLASPHRNKHVLAQTIMGFAKSWARPLESTWYVRSNESEGTIEGHLAGLLDTDDGLLIQAVKEDAVMTNTSLRWFRQRRAALEIADGSNIIVFPAQSDINPVEPELPFAEAC